MKQIYIPLLTAFILCLLFAGCTPTTEPESSSTIETSVPAVTVPPAESSETPSITLVPEFEVTLVAKVLRGECYDDQPDDKREVAKVICNRVSVSGFGDYIEAVVTAPKQFIGYRPGNEPTTSDYEIAREVLTAWYESGCQPMGEYLFFSAGGNHKNVFRKNY